MYTTYIIIVNYCGPQDTIACLESVFKSLYSNYHVIVVDNCSSDNSIDIIRSWAEGKLEIRKYNEKLSSHIVPFIQKPIRYQYFDEDEALSSGKQSRLDDLTIIRAKSNKGFSSGNNIGLRYALLQNDADYFWLLNNDTVVHQSALCKLVDCHHQHEEKDKISIVGGKLLYYNHPDIIQCLGGGIYNKFLGIVKTIGDGTPIGIEKNINVKRMDYINGACMLVKARFVEEVGLLSEDYFFYYEELDWCTRGRKKGWSIDYSNEAIVYHKVGATVNATQQDKQKSEQSDYYSVRSKLLYASKYNSLFTNAVIRLALLGTVVNRVLRGQFKRIIMIIKLSFTKY